MIFILINLFAIFLAVQKIRENQNSPLKALDAFDLEEAIKQKYIETASIGRIKNTKTRRVPWVHVTFKEDDIFIEVAKIAEIREKDQDQLIEIINSTLTGKYANFAVSRPQISDNKLSFLFYCEDVASDRTWTPRTIDELRQEPYMLKLQEGLEIDLSKSPGLVVWGKSGAGKTTFIFSLIAQMLTNSTQMIFLDGKKEFSPLALFYSKQCFFTDADEMQQALEVIVKKEIPRREKILQKEVERRKTFGLTGKDIGLDPIVIVADEVGNLVSDNKQRKRVSMLLSQIVKKARSLSITIIWGEQDPSVSASTAILPTGAISSMSTKIILSSIMTQIVAREAFGSSFNNLNLFMPKRRGYVLTDGMDQPEKYYLTDLYKNGLNDLESFEKIYKLSNVKPANQLIADFSKFNN